MRPDICIHYRGTQRPCAAGIDLRALAGGPDFGWGTRLPCHNLFPVKEGERAKCDKLRYPTAEEIAASDAEFQVYSSNATKARDAIVAHYKANAEQSPGKLPCPICTTGTLHYGIAKCNGHVRAQCTTEACVNFIE